MNVGTVIHSKYRITGILGEGAVGVVYLAEHLGLDKLCAIKVLKANLLHDQVAVERFRREAKAASRLVHPNIVSVFDFGGLADGVLFFAMEYVRGRPLNEVLRGVGLGVDRACRLLRQVADALVYAHGKGVVHRDIKPDNVMLEGYPQQEVFKPRILDFGLAKFIRERLAPITVKGQLFGTPEYMAPEQIVSAEVDHRADIYSFGAMAFEVLTGQTPFRGGFLEQLAAHRKEPPPRPSSLRPGEIPPELDEMVVRCMAKEPKDRYDSALELVGILDSVMADRAVRRSFRSSSGEFDAAGDLGETSSEAMAMAERICAAKWNAHGELTFRLYETVSKICALLPASDGLALALAQAVLFEDRARALRTEICNLYGQVCRVEESRDLRRKILMQALDVLKERLAHRTQEDRDSESELSAELDKQIHVLEDQIIRVDQEANQVLAEQQEWLAVLVRRFMHARVELTDYVSVLARMVAESKPRLPEGKAAQVDWSAVEELDARVQWNWADPVGEAEGGPHSGDESQ